MKITKSSKNGLHTIRNLSNDSLVLIYFSLLETGRSKYAEIIRRHLIDCVTKEDLKNSSASTAEEFIENWLGI